MNAQLNSQTNPQVVVKRQIRDLPLIAGFPGGLLLDLTSAGALTGGATAGIFRSTGEGEPSEVTHPYHEFKYIFSGELRVKQDGVTKSAFAGDLVHIPEGAVFTIIPVEFEAFYVSGRAVEFVSSSL